MKADGVKFRDLLSGKPQYRVPLFQRTYSWQEDQWQRLWDDILEVYSMETMRSHFIGAIVTLPQPDAPERSTKFMLIDGQQRMTTLFVILSVIRDAALGSDSSDLANEINDEYLFNKYAAIDTEREKMIPTRKDLVVFRAVTRGNRDGVDGQVAIARDFFSNVLKKGDLQGEEVSLSRLKDVITSYLDVVSIIVEQSDSPHKIFESLNHTGMSLSASDLIRNDIFMRIIDEREQEQAYSSKWFPMEQRLTRENKQSALSDFFWRYLMKDGALPRYDEVYEAMRDYIDSQTTSAPVTTVLDRLNYYSEFYAAIWRPDQHEESSSVKDRLMRLNQWEVDVAYPFLLEAMHQRAESAVSEEEFCELLKMIESYVVRRIICGVPTNRLRRIFGRMAEHTDTSDYLASCRDYLMENEWPSDKLFHEMFQTTRIYIPSRLSRTRLILTSLEHSFEHHESVDMSVTTIEHIMPQTLNDDWRSELGDDYAEIHEKYLHTIGNLTYSGYNSELGNAKFSYKKNILSKSHYEMNRYVVEREDWTEEEIHARGQHLADRALTIWKRDAYLNSI